MKIPSFLDKDNYLQNPIMRRFLKQNNIFNLLLLMEGEIIWKIF